MKNVRPKRKGNSHQGQIQDFTRVGSCSGLQPVLGGKLTEGELGDVDMDNVENVAGMAKFE